MSAPSVRKLTDDERRTLRVEGYPTTLTNENLCSYKWILEEDFSTSLLGPTIVIPAGFVCDGCSGGGIDKWGKQDWLLHDWLYATGGYTKYFAGCVSGTKLSRKDADSVFGWKWLHRWIAVRVAGWYAWGNGIRGRVRADLLEDKD